MALSKVVFLIIIIILILILGYVFIKGRDRKTSMWERNIN